ncbi:MAG: hypothetical protein JSS02_01010 [Planctomycetes bacterium]|nr:hypothetical protein [Planctomycetota bacterium]
MQADDRFVENPDEDLSVQTLQLPSWTWPVVSLLALLVFEVTADLAWTIVVLCIKFGLENLLTGLWLRRADPNPGRGWACFWFSLLVGVGKIFLSSALGIVLFVMVTAVIAPRGAAAANLPQLRTVAGTLMIVVCVAEVVMVLLGVIACCVARWHRVTIWISPVLHQARRESVWPPGDSETAGNRNSADVVLLPAIATGVVLLPVAAIYAIVNLQLSSAVVVPLTMAVAGCFLWLPFGVTAKSFVECWPETLLNAVGEVRSASRYRLPEKAESERDLDDFKD